MCIVVVVVVGELIVHFVPLLTETTFELCAIVLIVIVFIGGEGASIVNYLKKHKPDDLFVDECSDEEEVEESKKIVSTTTRTHSDNVDVDNNEKINIAIFNNN